jgi:Uncharacterized conserved protein
MEKTDFRKDDRAFYTGKAGVWTLVEVPEWRFLAIDGEGDPNTARAYAEAVRALYALSYGVKFHAKAVRRRDHAVGPLEGLWWADDMETFIRREKDRWKWRMMIRQPDWLDDADLAAVREATLKKAAKAAGEGADPEVVARVEFWRYREGLSAQALHVGAYDEEGPLLADLHDRFLPENGLTPSGRHHEIYLGDPRRTAPAKLKTILRQPVARRDEARP